MGFANEELEFLKVLILLQAYLYLFLESVFCYSIAYLHNILKMPYFNVLVKIFLNSLLCYVWM